MALSPAEQLNELERLHREIVSFYLEAESLQSDIVRESPGDIDRRVEILKRCEHDAQGDGYSWFCRAYVAEFTDAGPLGNTNPSFHHAAFDIGSEFLAQLELCEALRIDDTAEQAASMFNDLMEMQARLHREAARAALELQSALTLDPQGQYVTRAFSESESAPLNDATIPIEHRTKTITKQVAARYHAGRNMENPSAYFSDLIRRKLITPPVGGGRNWQFDIREFPEGVRQDLRGVDGKRAQANQA